MILKWMMNGNLCIIHGRHSIAHVHLDSLRYHLKCFEQLSIRRQAFSRYNLWFPHLLGNRYRWSQTHYHPYNGTSVLVIRDPSFSKRRLNCPPRVWCSPEMDNSKFILHPLSVTPWGSNWLRNNVMMAGDLLIASESCLQLDWRYVYM